jgi:hypothetical protein
MSDEEFNELELKFHVYSQMNVAHLTAAERVSAMSKYREISAAYNREYGIRMGWHESEAAPDAAAGEST